MTSKNQAGTIAAELEELSTKVGMLGQAFNVRTTTGRRFAHVHAARLQQQKRVEQLKKEVASTEVAESAKQDAKVRQAMRGGERVVASSLLVPIVHKFDRGQAALRYRRKVAPRVLIVDDNRIHGAAALITFRKAFDDVFFAANGRQALEIMEHQAIDVVFMDAVMPVMDGAETTDIIRYTEESAGGRDFRTLIVGMVTSEQATDANVMDDLFLAGMDRYIVKPLSTHLKAVSNILCVDGASVEGFRRKALEQHWVSHHDDLRVVLQGTEEERRRQEEIVSVTDPEVRKEKHVISNFRDDDKFSIEDLFARQRREDMARMQLNAARMRDRIRELEHELEDAKAVCKQLTENKHSDQILALERKRDAVTAELDLAQLENATLVEQNKTLSIDLKNLLSNGFANEKKVRAAERRSARLHHKMAKTEARMLQMEDRQALNAWGNYYGRLENRENRWAPPTFATNVAGSWYAGLLERVEALATDTGRRCAQSLDTVGSMMQRAQLPSATVEGLRDDVIQTLQGHIDHVDGLTSVHAEQMRDFVAQFIVREAKFWKMAQADDASLPRELRELVKRHDDMAREHLSNSEGCQTDFAEVEAPSFDGLDPNSPIGGDANYPSSTFLTATTTTATAGGGSSSTNNAPPSSGGSSNAGSKAGTPEPDLNVLPVLERLSSIVNQDSFVPTHIRRATMEQALKIARGIEERRYTELLRAVQELRKEVGEALSKLEDPAAKGIKLQPVLSSIRPHTFNEIKNAILDICDNVSTIVSVAADSVPKAKPGQRRGAAGAAAGSRGAASSRIATAAAAKTAAQNIRNRGGGGAKKDAPTKTGSRGGGDDSDTSMGRNRQQGGGRNRSSERQAPGLTRSRTTAAPFTKELTRDARSRAKLAPAGGRTSKGPSARNARPAIKAVNNEAAERLIKRQNDRAQSLAANARSVHRSPSPGLPGRSTSPANRATGESEAFTRAAVLAHATAAAIESALNHSSQVGPVQLDSATVAGFTIANLARISRTTEEQIRDANRDRPLPELAGDVIDGDAPLFLPIGAELLADAVEDARAGGGGHNDDGGAATANDDGDLAQDDDGRILTLADVLEDRLEMVRRVPSGVGSFDDSANNRSAVTSPPALTSTNDDGTSRRSQTTSKANTPVGKASPSTVKGKQVLGASKSMRRVANVAADAEATVSHQVVEPTTIADLARLFGANANDIISANEDYFREVFGETPDADAELDAGDRVKVPVTAQALRRNIMHSREGQRQTGGSFIPSRGTTPANEPSPRASHIAPVALDYAVAAALEQKTPVILVKHFVARIPASGDADDDAADVLPSATDIARMYDVSEADVEKANPFAFKGPEKLAVEGMTLSVPVASTHVASMLEEEKEALHEKLAGLTAEVAILEAAERDEDAAEARAELDAGRAVVARHRAAIAVLQNIERTNNSNIAKEAAAAAGRPRGSSVTTSPSTRKASTPGSGPASTKQGRTTSPLSQLPNVVSGDDLAGSMDGSSSFSTSTSPQARAAGGQRDRSRTFNAPAAAGGGRLQHSNTMSYAPRNTGAKSLMPGGHSNSGTASRRGSQLPPTGLPSRVSNSKQGSRSGSRVKSPDDAADESQPPSRRKGTVAGAALAMGTTDASQDDGGGESHGVVISVRSADDDDDDANDNTSRRGSAGGVTTHVPPSAILALHGTDGQPATTKTTTTAGERAAIMMASVNLTGVDEMPMLDSNPGTCVNDGTGKPSFSGSQPASNLTSPRATTPRDRATSRGSNAETPAGFTAPEIDVGSNHDDGTNSLATPATSFSARHVLSQTAVPRPMALPTSPVSNGHDNDDAGDEGAGGDTDASPREQSLTAAGGTASESASPPSAAVQPPPWSDTATSDAAVTRILAEAGKGGGGEVDRWSPVQHAETMKPPAAPSNKKGGAKKAAPPPVVATKRPAPVRKTAVLAKTVTAAEEDVVQPARTTKEQQPSKAPPAVVVEAAPPQPMIVSFGTGKLPGGHQKPAFEPSPLRAALASPATGGKRPGGAGGATTSRSGSPAAPNPASVTAFAAAMASQGLSKHASPRTAQQQHTNDSSTTGRRTASSSVPASAASGGGPGVAASGIHAAGGGMFSIVGSGAQRAGPDILGAPSVAPKASGVGGEANPNKGAAREAARIFGVKKDEMPGSKAASRAASRTGSPTDAAAGDFAAAVPPVTGNRVDAPTHGSLALVMGSSNNRGGRPSTLPPMQGGAPSSPLSKVGAAMPHPTFGANDDDDLPPGLVAVPIRKAHQLDSLAGGGGGAGQPNSGRGPSPGRASHGVRSPTGGPASAPVVTATATSDPLSTVRLDPAVAPPSKPLVPRPPPFGDSDLQPGSPRPPGPSGEFVERRRVASPPVPVGTRQPPPPHAPHPESARRAPVTEPPKQGRESPKRASLNLPVKRVDWKQRFTKQEPRTSTRRLGATPHRAGPPPRRAPGGSAAAPPVVDKDHLKSMFDRVALNGQ